MLDWIGSLRMREHSSARVVLSLSRSTRAAGWTMLSLGVYLVVLFWSLSSLLLLVPSLLIVGGAVLVTLRREFVFDRNDGVLRMDRRTLGIGTRSVVPLFHLRAVVIMARAEDGEVTPFAAVAPSRYVAFIERRVGDAIFLDEARRCAALMTLAEAIAEVAELRLEYDATFCAGD